MKIYHFYISLVVFLVACSSNDKMNHHTEKVDIYQSGLELLEIDIDEGWFMDTSNLNFIDVHGKGRVFVRISSEHNKDMMPPEKILMRQNENIYSDSVNCISKSSKNYSLNGIDLFVVESKEIGKVYGDSLFVLRGAFNYNNHVYYLTSVWIDGFEPGRELMNEILTRTSFNPGKASALYSQEAKYKFVDEIEHFLNGELNQVNCLINQDNFELIRRKHPNLLSFGDVVNKKEAFLTLQEELINNCELEGELTINAHNIFINPMPFHGTNEYLGNFYIESKDWYNTVNFKAIYFNDQFYLKSMECGEISLKN